jgi:alkylated DNA repair dioxygenase AlkB
MESIIHIDDFLTNSDAAFRYIRDNVSWDERMVSRKTASFGNAYNYSQISYPFQPMLQILKKMCFDLKSLLGFEPNNCLINYYENGKSKMGFHSDQTDILEKETGIAIISLGAMRILRFRNIQNRETIKDFELTSGSLLYMTQSIQHEWQHSILGSNSEGARISLTFRQILN